MKPEPIRPDMIIKRIEMAEEHLVMACGTQSLLRIHEQIQRAGQQLEGVKEILRAAGGMPIVYPPG